MVVCGQTCQISMRHRQVFNPDEVAPRVVVAEIVDESFTPVGCLSSGVNALLYGGQCQYMEKLVQGREASSSAGVG